MAEQRIPEKCCCRTIRLQAAPIIIGVLGIIVAIWYTIGAISDIQTTKTPILEYALLVVTFLGSIIYGCLIVGSTQKKRWLYVPYLIYEVRIIKKNLNANLLAYRNGCLYWNILLVAQIP
jgi:hypothetical protein